MTFSNPTQPTGNGPGATGPGATGPLNAFVFLDYVTMIMKRGVQDALSEFRSTTVVPGATGPRSLSTLAQQYPASSQAPTGIRVAQIARANQQLPLDAGATLTFSGVSFVPSPSSSLDAVAQQFGVAATALASFKVNPQLSYMPLPQGITAVRFIGAAGATAVKVPKGASFQNLAQQQGITGAAIDPSLLWPNLDVVSQLLAPGQPIQIPTFAKGLTGPTSLLSLASYYDLTVDALAQQNADGAIFGPTAAIAIPFAERLTVGHLLNRLATDGFGPKTAGLAGRTLLHGLCLPPPDSPTGPRQGLYALSGQQVGLAGVTAGSMFEFTYAGATAPAWLHFHGMTGGAPTGVTGATGFVKPSIKYPIGHTGLAQIQALAGQTAYKPAGSFVRLDPFHIREKSFSLAHSITWNVPRNPLGPTGIMPPGPTGAYGTMAGAGGTAAPLGNYYIRSFPERLQSLLQAGSTGGTGATAIPFTLTRQAIQSGKSAANVPVPPCAWTTMLQVRVAQVPKAGSGAHEFVYVLEGTSETEKSLLAQILAAQVVPQNIFLLYPATTAQAGQKSSNVALTCDPEPMVALVQTNPSTVGGAGLAIGATELLRQIWVGDQLAEAGIYLYYRAATGQGGGKGLPGYLFAKQPTATLTLLISYTIPAEGPVDNPAYCLPGYVNSVVLNTAIQTSTEGIYIRPLAPATGFHPNLQTKTPALHPGHVAFRISRPNPNYPAPPAPGSASPTHLLNELYSIVEARVPGQTAWCASRPGLPVAPQNPAHHGPTAPAQFHYDVSFPIARLARTRTPCGPTGPTAGADPYAGIGATLTVNFNLLDLYGNTFTRVDGEPWMSSTLQPGYTDMLVGPDAWPHVAKTYMVHKSGRLAVDLTFNANYFFERQEAKEPATSLLAAAQAMQASYAKIYYQLIQPDVAASITTNFDPGSSYNVTPALRQFVGNCWVAIDGVVAALMAGRSLPPVSPVAGTLQADLTDASGLDILPLNVSLDVIRSGLIDPNFTDLPAVRKVGSRVAPLTSRGATGSNHLNRFATAFEDAFPAFKVATGQSSASSPGPRGSASKGIWLVRLAATAADPGICVRLQDDPIYYAPRPVATSLVNRTKVPIYSIEQGKTFNHTINDPNAGAYLKYKSYNGLDLNTMAQQLLGAVDQALLPDTAAAAAIAAPGHLQRLIQSKAGLAFLLSLPGQGSSAPDPVPRVYEDVMPPPGGRSAAGQALQSELLAELGRYSKVEAIVQCGVECHWENQKQPGQTVEFFGKFSPRAQQTQSAFAFSSSSIPVNQGATGSHVTALFSANQNRVGSLGSTAAASFTDDVTFHVTGFAHDIAPSVVPGYKQANWLSFVRPFELGHGSPAGPTATPLPLDIPLPLRAYPTAPALKSQNDVPRLAQFGQAPQGATTTFKTAAEWSYQYSYQYVGAAQDTISTTLAFNVAGATGSGATGPGPGGDLVTDLLQFKALYQGLAKDMAHLQEFLVNPGVDTNSAKAARLAFESFAELVEYIAQSWATWREYQKTYVYEYEIEQSPQPAGATAAPLLSVQVRKVKGPAGTYPHHSIPLPGIEIAGFTALPTPPLSATTVGRGATCIDYVFKAIGSTGATAYLRWEESTQHPRRTVSFAGLNVLKQENAWAGLAVMRNKDLGKIPGTERYRPVNPAFIFETPLVRFVNVLNPFLDPAGAVYLPDEVSPLPATLEGYLTAMFAKLFEGLPAVLVKLGVSYGYTLGEGLPVELPMFLTTPCKYNAADDSAFVNTVANRITSWFSERGMHPARPGMAGSLVFDLTVFSTLSKTQLPILRLRYIELPCSDVTW